MAATITPEIALERFHARRETTVASPQGALALVNTQWIDSEQPIYGVPGVWSPLPAGESGLRVTASAADGITVDGVLVDGEAVVRGRDTDAPGAIDFGAGVTGFVIASEEGSYALRVWDAASDAITDFGGIDAFEYNPDWVVDATFTEIPGGTTMGFSNLKDNGVTHDEIVPGEITFTRDGVEYNLAAFKAGNVLQLVYGDATNGDSTYSVGRFLFVVPGTD
jgi:uncharacterized protein (DUF1684 family)